MKRVLIFSLAYYPLVGGAEVAVRNITDRISSGDFEFEMVTLRFRQELPEIERIGNILVHRIGKGTFFWKRWFQVAAFLKGSALHRAKPFDVVWGMMAHSGGIPAMLFKSRFPNVRYVLTLQEGDPISHIKRTMIPAWPLFVNAFRKADVVQPISIYLGNWARDMGFRGPLHIIPNAVDTKHFSQEYSKEELNMLKENLGKKDGDVYIITTSRIVKKNGIADVIDSLQLLPLNYAFLILGVGPLEENLKFQVADLKLQDRVQFLGQINHRELPKYLKISDIFTRPSLSEGMGNSFVEAMAAGLPVVATQEGGIADFLFDPDKNPDKKPTWLAVKPRDPKGLARQFKRLMEDRELREEIIKNARELAFEKYDWDLITEEMRNKVFSLRAEQSDR